jgi:hypothetical protein
MACPHTNILSRVDTFEIVLVFLTKALSHSLGKQQQPVVFVIERFFMATIAECNKIEGM